MLHLAGACAMPSQTNERAIVHVVDDDASMRGALEGLFDSVGLDTQTYATAREFLWRRRAHATASSPTFRCQA
jgi:FixJ family two-component response regulator